MIAKENKFPVNCNRASLFNLVVYVRDEHRIPYFHNLVQNIIQQFPCRVIFIQVNHNNNGEGVKITPSIIVIGQGESSLACDLITINLPQSQLAQIPFILWPNLGQDLPILLLLDQDPAADFNLLPVLGKTASRLIFDVMSQQPFSVFCRNILTLMTTHPNLPCIDLNWIMISGWRELLGQLFETTQDFEQLCSIRSLLVRYNALPSLSPHFQDTQALYFINWLASVCQWQRIDQHIEGQERVITYHNGKEEFTILLSPESHESLAMGCIVYLEIQGFNEHHLRAAQLKNEAKIVVQKETSETCEMPITISMPSLKGVGPYVRDLIYSLPSNHYRKTLQEIVNEEW